MRLAVTAGKTKFHIELRDTPTAQALLAAVPFESRAQTWGDEVYFSTPVSTALERDARQIVEPGAACFWTEGNAIALPFGRTPISTDERPKLASRCNLLGKVDDCSKLASVRPGDAIRVEAA